MTVVKAPCDEGVLRGRGAAQVRPEALPESAAGPWILAATILGSSMAFIDSSAVNVALPALQRELGATVSDVQWVVEAYALLLAALILTGGALGDLYGRRRVFMAGVGLFAVASAACGLAPGIGALIAARAAQGASAALLVPGSLAIISASYPPDRRGRAIGTWSGWTGITAVVGPLLGGWLIDHAGWRWVFFINAPLSLLVLAVTARHVPESRDPEAVGALDWPGAALATAGLGGVTFALIELPRAGTARQLVFGSLVGGCAALAGFVLVEARERAPMMPLSLFRSRTFTGANLLTLWLYGALGGALFFLPFRLIQVEGYSATAAGAAFVPVVLLMFSLSRWAGGLVDRYGARRPLVAGPFIAACGFALLAAHGPGGSYWTSFFPAMVVLGLGMTVSVAPLTTAVMGAVEVRHAGIASGVNNAVARVASLLAIAALGLLVLAAFGRGLDRRLARLDLPPAAVQELRAERLKLAAAKVPAGLAGEQRRRAREAVAGAFVDSYRLAMLVAAGLALLSSACAALTIEDNRPASRSRPDPGRPGRAER
jgi:EmrB/QacA subfamily drug resistance transporter